MLEPKISIIVPVYEVESYLYKCVDSILKQTFLDFELILVNDGSPDRCGDICNEYAEQDSRIKVIHKENGGLSSARNAGLKVARGAYIGFVDSDDYIHEQMYEMLYIQAVLHSSDLVVCDLLKVTEEQVVDREQKLVTNCHIRNFNNIEALYQLYVNKSGTDSVSLRTNVKWIIACNKLYKKSLFENLRYNEGRIFEDEFIIHKILFSSAKITYIPRHLYYYLQRPNSLLSSTFSLKRMDKVYALQERADFFKSIEQPHLYNLALVSLMDGFFWYYYKAKLNLTNVHKDLRTFKRVLNKNFFTLMNNPLLGWKHKVMLVLFVSNPYIYELFKSKCS